MKNQIEIPSVSRKQTLNRNETTLYQTNFPESDLTFLAQFQTESSFFYEFNNDSVCGMQTEHEHTHTVSIVNLSRWSSEWNTKRLHVLFVVMYPTQNGIIWVIRVTRGL